MKVTVARNAGFCSGVKNAVDTALRLAEEYGEVFTVGALIHNEGVVKYLEERGVRAVTPEQARALPAGSVALIRAHGIPREEEALLRSHGVKLFDATCPVVKRIHRIVEERSAAGDEIVIVGDRNHDEVAGAASYADDVRVISDKEEPIFSEKPTSVVFQTTILADRLGEISRIAENSQKNGGKTVGIFNTICYTTISRQNEARELARTHDAVLVVGSRSSANTRRLYEVASEVNPRTYFVTCAEDLPAKKIKHLDSISIVAGASTPPWLIQEVTKLMSETQNVATAEINVAEEEAKKEATLREEESASEQSAPEKELTMEDVVASTRATGFVNYKVGKRVFGKVLRADESGIYVSIGGKKDGFIDKADATADGEYDPQDYKAGDDIEANIIAVKQEYVALSKKEVDLRRAEDEAAEKALNSAEFSLKMTEVVKGGLRGRMGKYTVFVPASQIRMGYVKNLEDYKDKTLRLTLMPPKEKEHAEGEEGEDIAVESKPEKKSRYLFASQRIILEREKKEKEDNFWNNIHVNDIVEGKVKRFTEFGAFVNVRGFDCLAHISELSWNKINDPSLVLKIGETYDFVVLKMDREHGRISLGYKQLQKKPYEVAAEMYPVGSVIKGKVERIFPFGAFISIADGVDGLVHVSQISHNWIKDASEVLKVGDEVEAKIISFEDNRITLSIKDLLPEPEATETAETAESESGEERSARRASRMKKFAEKLDASEERKERRPRKDAASNEPKEWVSGSSNATLGDLFKNLNLQLDDEKAEEAPSEEEAPQKKTPRKKKTEEEAPVEE